MKRKLALLIVIVMILGSMMSISSTSAQGGANILVWMTGSEIDADILSAAVEGWEAATGNTVTVEPVDWGTAHARILTAATSGEGPDIITGGLSWGIEFGELGGMVNLAERYPDAVAAMGEASNQGIWESIVSTDGSVFGVPYDLTTYLVYYRHDLFEEAGLEYPQTWEDLMAVHEYFHDANGGEGGFAIGWGNTDWLGFSNYLYQAGGDFYDEDCNITIDQDEAIDALEFYAGLYEAGVTTDTSAAIEAGLDSGLYPIAMTGTWVAGGLDAGYPDMTGKWSVGVAPAGPTGARTVFIGGRVIGIMSFSDNVDESFDMIQYLYTEAAALATIEYATTQNVLWIPPQDAFQQHIAYGENVRDTLMAQLADANGPPNCSGWESSQSDVTLQLQAVIFDDADAEDALAEAAAIMDENLD